MTLVTCVQFTSCAVHDPGMDSLSNFSYMAMAITHILGVYLYIYTCMSSAMYIEHYSLRLSVSATLCHPCAYCTDPALTKTYNGFTNSLMIICMQATCIHMQRVFLVSAFVPLYLAIRVCKSLHACVASYTRGTCACCLVMRVFVSALCMSHAWDTCGLFKLLYHISCSVCAIQIL